MTHQEALAQIKFNIEHKASRINYIERCMEFGDRSDAKEFIALVEEVRELLALKKKVEALIASGAKQFSARSNVGSAAASRHHHEFVQQQHRDMHDAFMHQHMHAHMNMHHGM